MIPLFSFLFTLLDWPGGVSLVYALQTGATNTIVNRIELPVYYLFFILFGIVVLTWVIIKIFCHDDHNG